MSDKVCLENICNMSEEVDLDEKAMCFRIMENEYKKDQEAIIAIRPWMSDMFFFMKKYCPHVLSIDRAFKNVISIRFKGHIYLNMNPDDDKKYVVLYDNISIATIKYNVGVEKIECEASWDYRASTNVNTFYIPFQRLSFLSNELFNAIDIYKIYDNYKFYGYYRTTIFNTKYNFLLMCWSKNLPKDIKKLIWSYCKNDSALGSFNNYRDGVLKILRK